MDFILALNDTVGSFIRMFVEIVKENTYPTYIIGLLVVVAFIIIRKVF